MLEKEKEIPDAARFNREICLKMQSEFSGRNRKGLFSPQSKYSPPAPHPSSNCRERIKRQVGLSIP